MVQNNLAVPLAWKDCDDQDKISELEKATRKRLILFPKKVHGEECGKILSATPPFLKRSQKASAKVISRQMKYMEAVGTYLPSINPVSG